MKKKSTLHAMLTKPLSDVWVQDCSNSIADAMELLQTHTKPSASEGLVT